MDAARMRTIGMVILLTGGVGMAACVHRAAGGDGASALFRRGVPLDRITEQGVPVYPEADPGDTKPLPRSFAGAPPTIPHATDGYDEVSLDRNDCMDCHAPDTTDPAEIPIPASHREHPVVRDTGPDEAMQNRVVRYETRASLNPARYGCTMCHTPAATNVSTPASLFVRDD